MVRGVWKLPFRMKRVRRYFRNIIIVALGLHCFFALRNQLAGGVGTAIGRHQTRLRPRTRMLNTNSNRTRTKKFPRLDNLPNCNEQWRRGGSNTTWFSEKFDPLLSPIWTKENIYIPAQVFVWWNNLHRKAGYVRVTSLVRQLALNSDLFLGNKPHDCITCAVVGNSGNMRKSGYGRMIDDHDIIIRMNECPTVGYEEDVGSRTTHYIAYPQSFKEASLGVHTSLVLAAFCYNDMELLHRKLLEQSSQLQSRRAPRHIDVGRTAPLDRNKIFILNPEVMWQIKHKWGIGRGRYPSTGLLSIFFALQMCDEVDVFGFGATSKGNWDHYFADDDGEKNSVFRTTLVHDSIAEELLLRKLIEVKRITIYKGLR